jgi:hypothetical protein
MDDETKVRVDHLLLRRAIASLDPLRERDLLRRGEQRVAADLVQEELDGIRDTGDSAGLMLGLLRFALVLVFEQRLDFRGFEDAGADDGSFRFVGDGRSGLVARGRGLVRRSRPLVKTTRASGCFPLEELPGSAEARRNAAFAANVRTR